MHDPYTVAHELRGWITVWHRDPEHDGSDDSCDWFGGKRCPKTILDKITEAFLFESRDDGAMSWFDSDKYSPDLLGVGICMFRVAANCHFGHWSKAADKFLNSNIFNILHFIDNGCDSINCAVREANASKGKVRERIVKNLAHIVYSWILRQQRPWWRHPRWHFWHWRLQIHPLQNFKRRWWDKCCICGKRGFSEPAIGNWSGSLIAHQSCNEKACDGGPK